VTVPGYAWVILLVVFPGECRSALESIQSSATDACPHGNIQLNLSQAGLLMSVFAFTGLILAYLPDLSCKQ